LWLAPHLEPISHTLSPDDHGFPLKTGKELLACLITGLPDYFSNTTDIQAVEDYKNCTQGKDVSPSHHLNATNQRYTNVSVQKKFTMSAHFEHMLAELQPGIRSDIQKAALDIAALNNPDTLTTQALQAHLVALGTKADKLWELFKNTRTSDPKLAHNRTASPNARHAREDHHIASSRDVSPSPARHFNPPITTHHHNQPPHAHTLHKDCAAHGPNNSHTSAECTILRSKVPSPTDRNAIIDHYNRTGELFNAANNYSQRTTARGMANTSNKQATDDLHTLVTAVTALTTELSPHEQHKPTSRPTTAPPLPV
jgi:hypothetical protein